MQVLHLPRKLVLEFILSIVPATIQPQVEYFQNKTRELGSGYECAIHGL